jgi:hypothetical protein
MRLADFSEVAEAVAVDDVGKADVACRLRELEVAVRPRGERNVFDLRLPDGERCEMQDWAAAQLFQKRLKIPVEFLAERCPAGLAQQIVDHFLAAEPPRAMLVRCRGAEGGRRVRAVLPATFARFDNRDFVDVASEVADAYGLRVQQYRVTELTFTCRLVFSEAVDAGPPGRRDDHHFGVFLRTSEVGYGVPEAQMTVVREVCANGMLGFSEEPIFRLPASSLHGVSKARLAERFRAGLERGMRERDRVVATIRAARQRKVRIEDLMRELHAINRQHGLSKRNLEIVREAFLRETRDPSSRETTAFALASALNRAAQHLPGEDAIAYETAAWRELSRRSQ